MQSLNDSDWLGDVWPAGQLAQLVLLAVSYLPAWQLMQSPELSWPEYDEYLPTLHKEQLMRLVVSYLPAGQVMQLEPVPVLDEDGWYLPAVHKGQEVSKVYRPAEQVNDLQS